VRFHKIRQWVVDDKVIDLVKISTKKSPADMMTKTIPVEKFKASLNFIGLLGGSHVKSQKGEKGRRMKQRPISTEGLNEHESRWRLLVFGVPHIHWRRIQVFGSFLIPICLLFWFEYKFPISLRRC